MDIRESCIAVGIGLGGLGLRLRLELMLVGHSSEVHRGGDRVRRVGVRAKVGADASMLDIRQKCIAERIGLGLALGLGLGLGYVYIHTTSPNRLHDFTVKS